MTIGSLFSGIGGLELGLEMCGPAQPMPTTMSTPPTVRNRNQPMGMTIREPMKPPPGAPLVRLTGRWVRGSLKAVWADQAFIVGSACPRSESNWIPVLSRRWGPGIRWRWHGHEKAVQATHEGVLKFGEMELPCAVLADGRRVLSQRGVGRALGRKHGGKDWRSASEAGGNLPFFLIAADLKPFISNDMLVVASNPIRYHHSSAATTAAMEATMADQKLTRETQALLAREALELADALVVCYECKLEPYDEHPDGYEECWHCWGNRILDMAGRKRK